MTKKNPSIFISLVKEQNYRRLRCLCNENSRKLHWNQE